VIYYLKTDAICSYIQFYFNKNEQFTSAIPKVYVAGNDKKLEALIGKLENHANQGN
jgi:hypothetical protein